jgi:hypothetical protein
MTYRLGIGVDRDETPDEFEPAVLAGGVTGLTVEREPVAAPARGV